MPPDRRERAERLKSHFLSTVRAEPDPRVGPYWARYQRIFSAAGLSSATAETRTPLTSGLILNVSRDASVSGGAITAALFLREFVGTRRWAHLDIAGPARADRDEHEVSRGGTGFGARLLLRWLEGLR